MWIRLVIGSVLLVSACTTDGVSDQQELGLHDLGECGVSWSFEPSQMWKCEPGCYARPIDSSGAGCRALHPDFEQHYGCLSPIEYEGNRGCCKAFEDERMVRFFVCDTEL